MFGTANTTEQPDETVFPGLAAAKRQRVLNRSAGTSPRTASISVKVTLYGAHGIVLVACIRRTAFLVNATQYRVACGAREQIRSVPLLDEARFSQRRNAWQARGASQR